MQLSPVSAPFCALPIVPAAVIPGVEIVMPCFNEARRLDIPALLLALATTPGLRLVCVDDGSTDGTLAMLHGLRDAAPERVRVLALHRNQGKAEAVRQGLLTACTGPGAAALVGYWDADLATPMDAVEDFRRVMTRLPDIQVVFGSRRALLGHRINRTPMRRAVSRICATLARAAIGLSVGDTQCGAKLLRNSAPLRQALARPFDSGWLFDVELFARLCQQLPRPREAFFELPLAQWNEVPGSKVSGRAILTGGVQMLRLIGRTRLWRTPGNGQAA